MTDNERRELAAENAILRGHLYLTAHCLDAYQKAPAFEIDEDGSPRLEVIISPTLREQAAEELKKAQAMLQAQPRPTVTDPALQPSQARPDRTSDLIGTLESVRATLKLLHIGEASDDDVAKALQIADAELTNARGLDRGR